MFPLEGDIGVTRRRRLLPPVAASHSAMSLQHRVDIEQSVTWLAILQWISAPMPTGLPGRVLILEVMNYSSSRSLASCFFCFVQNGFCWWQGLQGEVCLGSVFGLTLQILSASQLGDNDQHCGSTLWRDQTMSQYAVRLVRDMGLQGHMNTQLQRQLFEQSVTHCRTGGDRCLETCLVGTKSQAVAWAGIRTPGTGGYTYTAGIARADSSDKWIFTLSWAWLTVP